MSRPVQIISLTSQPNLFALPHLPQIVCNPMHHTLTYVASNALDDFL